jgi:hypothetical protein
MVLQVYEFAYEFFRILQHFSYEFLFILSVVYFDFAHKIDGLQETFQSKFLRSGQELFFHTDVHH